MRRLLSFVQILILFSLTSCAKNPEMPSSPMEFPLGLFESDEVQGIGYQFKGDETFIMFWQRDEYLTGEWSIEGNKLYTQDLGTGCKNPATYKWIYNGEILSFKAIEDDCSERISNMDGKMWKLVEKD